MNRPPCVMKWDDAAVALANPLDPDSEATVFGGYVPVTNAIEASDLAKRCIYRSSDHPGLTIEGRAKALLGELATCETNEERQAAIAAALLAESATPVPPEVAASLKGAVVGRAWLEEWSKRSVKK